MRTQSTPSKRRAGLALLLAGVVIASTVGPALAAPRVFVASATLETSETVAGDAVDVHFQLRNTGDSGAGQVQIRKNGTVVFSDRYQVESGQIRNITEQISIAEPGVYNISVNDKRAGILQVRQTTVETAAVRSDGRTLLLRGGRIEYDSVLTTEFPTTNDTFAVESLTYRSLRNEFNRTVETYTNASSAPVSIPMGDGTTVYGVATIQSVTGIEDQRVRIGVNRTTVDESSLTGENVSIYRASNGNYHPLNTTVVGTEDGRYVFEATTNDTDTLLVGSLASSFEVTGHSLSTSTSGIEKRIVVTANVTNTGSVTGNYTGSMLVDGTVVNTTTIRLAPGESREVVISDRIKQDGTYQIALDDEQVGVVLVETGSGGQQTATPTATESTATATTTATVTPAQGGEGTGTAGPTETETQTATTGGSSGDDPGGFGISLPDSDVGLTEIAIGGGVAVIGVILVLLQRW